ncbi:MAG: hypothetical protein WC761_00545 [Candidatus Paceibacterota bacterium]|jgi:hypothetical protein
MMTTIKKIPVILNYENASHRGPGKVVQNLEKGLDLLGIEHGKTHLFRSDVRAYEGFLQTVPDMFGKWSEKDSHSLVGPNLFVLPSDWTSKQCKNYKHYIVPSQWVADLYRMFPVLDHATIDVWPVGIDTEKWDTCARAVRTVGPLADLKCLLYYKNRNESDLKLVKRIIEKYKIEYRLIEYGKYKEDQLWDACGWANMGVVLTDTESQGIAYMEMLSSDLPLFVFNKSWWDNEGKMNKVPASSVPYFDERCGEVCYNVDLGLFERFIDKVKNWKYSPRKYILENHTLTLSAQNYYNLLAKYQTYEDESVDNNSIVQDGEISKEVP